MKHQTSHLSKRAGQTLLAGSVALLLSACSMVGSLDEVRDSVEYKNNSSINPLEVPPDLSKPNYDNTYAAVPGSAVAVSTLGQGQDGTGAVLPTSAAIQLMRSGNVRWLQINAPAEAIWAKTRDFWRTMGLTLKRDEPLIGIMETDWAENRAEVPLEGVRKVIGRVFEGMYDAGSRDRFKVRLEREGQLVNLYLSHERAEEQISPAGGSKWQYVPAKPELEAEMLSRLMLFFQGKEGRAQVAEMQQTGIPISLTQLDGGQPALAIGGSLNDVWIRTGVMLGRLGMDIESQQRSNGIYLVNYVAEDNDGSGFFGRLFGRGGNAPSLSGRYQIQIANTGKQNLITVGDAEGKPLVPAVATALLERLKAEFER